MPAEDAIPGSRRLWLGLLLPAFVLLVSGLVIASGRGGPSEASDQDKYHLPVIDGMVAQWPAIDIVNYPSATSPGYHALMAMVRVTLGPESGPVGVRAVNALFGALVPLGCFLVASRFTTGTRAALLTAPLAMNSYILGGSMYLTTDNLAYLCVFLAFGTALRPLTPARASLAGLGAVLAVAVRQIHVWTIAPLGVAALLASPLAARLPGASRGATGCWRVAGAAIIGCAAACALLATFVALWGGLTPPADTAAKHAAGMNLASVALALSLVGVFGPLLGAGEILRSLREGGVRWALGGAAVGLVSALAVPTSYELRHRAYGWLWKIVERAPDVAERSTALVVLATIGGAALGGLACAALRRGRWRATSVLAVGALAWLAAQTMNSMAWQRYYEPMALVLTTWLIALAWSEAPKGRGERALAVGGAVALALAQLALTALTLGREVLAADAVRF